MPPLKGLISWIRKIIGVKYHPPLWLVMLLFLAFLLARNWPVFGLLDVYDGSIVKTDIVRFSAGGSLWKEYYDQYILGSYNQHFIPVWFAIFFLISEIFDSAPLAYGLFVFSGAALLLALIYKITAAFEGVRGYDKAAALIPVLLFASTPFFLEAIAWKWMACLLLSGIGFTLCAYILAGNLSTRKKLGVYVLGLVVCVWSFGTGWIWAAGLALYIILSRKTKDVPLTYLWATIIISALGLATSLYAGKGEVGELNLIYVAANFPGAAVMVPVNLILNFFGLAAFNGVGILKTVLIPGLFLLLLLAILFVRQIKDNILNSRLAFFWSMIIVYLVMLGLSLARIMPSGDTFFNTEPSVYIMGNRYLLAYSIPLILGTSVMLYPFLEKLKSGYKYYFLLFAACMGIFVQLHYASSEPLITNLQRNGFYDATPAAVTEASKNKMALPDIKSDLLFPGQEMNLSTAVYIRKGSASHRLAFKPENSLTNDECNNLKSNPIVRDWINIYSDKQWCA